MLCWVGEIGEGLGLGDHLLFKTVAHGVSGGIQSGVFGGNFNHGFMSGALGNVAGHLGGNDIVKRTLYAGAAAGVTNHSFGGSFGQGFQMGAYNQLYNWSLHEGMKAIGGFINTLVPKYGNYGGPGWTGGKSGNKDPKATMDKLFKAHDFSYENKNYIEGDRVLVEGLKKLSDDPYKWETAPINRASARAYRMMAFYTFNTKLLIHDAIQR